MAYVPRKWSDPWNCRPRKDGDIPKGIRDTNRENLPEDEYHAYRCLREALIYRSVRPADGGRRLDLYEGRTIQIRCADHDDVTLHVDMSFKLLKLRTWKLQFLVDTQVVAEVKGAGWKEKS